MYISELTLDSQQIERRKVCAGAGGAKLRNVGRRLSKPFSPLSPYLSNNGSIGEYFP